MLNPNQSNRAFGNVVYHHRFVWGWMDLIRWRCEWEKLEVSMNYFYSLRFAKKYIHLFCFYFLWSFNCYMNKLLFEIMQNRTTVDEMEQLVLATLNINAKMLNCLRKLSVNNLERSQLINSFFENCYFWIITVCIWQFYTIYRSSRWEGALESFN